MLYIAHIKWLNAISNYRFSISGNISFANNRLIEKYFSAKVLLRKMTIKTFYNNYLKKSWLYRENGKGFSDNEPKLNNEEIFAFFTDNTKGNDDPYLAANYFVNVLQLYGYSNLQIGNGILLSDRVTDSYNKNDLIYFSGESAFYSNSELLNDRSKDLLDNNSRNKFRNFLNNNINYWNHIGSKSYLRIAFMHFFSALKDQLLEEQILHLIIALEALLSPPGSQELSHRVSQNTSILLGKNPNERENIYNLVHDGYKVRSSLAHGEFNGFDEGKYFMKTKKTPKICVKFLQNIVRDSLLRCLLLNKDREKLREMIEKDVKIQTHTINKLSKNGLFNYLW